ncbi:hypothetical protein TRFO_21350 [Tritrichomonas foetus]|uniref:Ubiquitin-like domain-containing protein n=1 Tax=Tritrichomonas foetus TaxID=1144522 RepID=A0A1J4KE61_9EUKA|nr:hypothetical protein TRFO_21350 [Tritrichomonas foetus]|eukprot:OHT09719.1 hypothetical protein TRFO_21350 [Tritrichomonas foetus]
MTEQPRRSNRIHIFLCPPKMMVQKVSIVPTRPVGCLNKLFSEEKIFIYKGILLQNEKPFSEYRIVEGSQLIMFSKKKGSTSESNQMNAWMHITRDQDDILNKTSYHPNLIYQTHGKDPTESFLDTDNDMYNNNIVMNEDNNHHEFAKLRDIRYLQMENSSIYYV